MTEKTMTADEFDEYFDNGGDITPYIIPGSDRQPGLEGKVRVNINMPEWLVDRLDAEARRLAVSRQAVINMWLAERFDERDRGIA